MTELIRDGVRLWYTEAGNGDPPLLFVHGWCGDHGYVAPQLEGFAGDHRVIAVDLRGHGASDKPVEDYTVDGFADDLIWLAGQLELTQLVLVGHSLGGVVVLEAAASRPDLIAAAVLIDPAPIVKPPGLTEVARELVIALHGPDYLDAARQHIEHVLFAPGDDAGTRARVADAMCRTPQHVMASAMEQIFAWEGEAALGRCHVPVLIVSTTTTFNDVAQCQELCPSISVTSVDASHFAQLLEPEQVNAAIDNFLAAVSLTSAGTRPAASRHPPPAAPPPPRARRRRA